VKQIITAIIRPALAPIVSGDTVEDALSADVDQTSNYASTAGTIATVQVDILVNGETPAALDIPLDAGDTIALSVTVTDSEANVRVFTASRVVGAVVPAAFDVADWGLANDDGDISVNILTLPDDGGAPITDIEYRVNGGEAVSFGETTTGSYPIVADEADEVEIRAVNAVDPGDWSDVKVVPAAGPLFSEVTWDADADTYTQDLG
jgi:hypothetical protein